MDYTAQLRDTSSINSDGIIEFKRNDLWINNWNPVIAIMFRSNHDISFIMAKARALTLMYYITEYATKAEIPLHEQVGIGTTVKEAQTSDTQSEKGNSFAFIIRIIYKIQWALKNIKPVRWVFLASFNYILLTIENGFVIVNRRKPFYLSPLYRIREG